MRKYILIGVLCWAAAISVRAQSDSVRRIPYNSDYVFNEGIYLSVDEWKNNAPKITEFKAIRTNAYGAMDQIELTYNCTADDGSRNTCTLDNCFAYVKENKLYFSQGFYGYYFRVFIVGSLTHFMAYSSFDMDRDYYYGNMTGLMSSDNDFQEYLLDFETGQAFRFTYKIFSEFLKTRDAELYQQLMESKRKRKMIHHFLLKYNEKHPAYVPAP